MSITWKRVDGVLIPFNDAGKELSKWEVPRDVWNRKKTVRCPKSYDSKCPKPICSHAGYHEQDSTCSLQCDHHPEGPICNRKR